MKKTPSILQCENTSLSIKISELKNKKNSFQKDAKASVSANIQNAKKSVNYKKKMLNRELK